MFDAYLKLYLIPRLQNMGHKCRAPRLRTNSKPCPAPQSVKYIYYNTETGSKLRTLLSGCVAINLSLGRIEREETLKPDILKIICVGRKKDNLQYPMIRLLS